MEPPDNKGINSSSQEMQRERSDPNLALSTSDKAARRFSSSAYAMLLTGTFSPWPELLDDTISVAISQGSEGRGIGEER